ncbi:putative defense protein Hdd11 [Neodiprion pinetum]|uniref:Defense protein Hdd11 n=1 Tax=Neodiprion lecontei TaxID=441921 RepID=A0A6J0CFP3_NEOLC|nr:putative defense protein Hdd11 [Neodiprion lecontei]XP_046471096.1 putative defense protein Hdd11 [Neodiprion pinetum]
MLRFFLLIASIVAAAQGFSAGAPPAVCEDMTPKHHVDPQAGPSPFKISIDKSTISPGDKVEITLEALDHATFKGFLVEGRQGNDIIGSFSVDPNDKEAQTIDCPKGEKNAVTHKNSEEKSKKILTWEAPADFSGIVVFKATFVKDGGTFWVGQTSSNLRVVKH